MLKQIKANMFIGNLDLDPKNDQTYVRLRLSRLVGMPSPHCAQKRKTVAERLKEVETQEIDTEKKLEIAVRKNKEATAEHRALHVFYP